MFGEGHRQFGELGLSLWVVAIGVLLFVVGSAIVAVATFDLGVSQTQGMEEGLQTDGLYAYSRNPQYVGYIFATVGYALVANAPFVVPICLLLLVWWLVLPFVEEPWLRAQYGREYERYTEQVPRFIGPRSFREHPIQGGNNVERE
jgi:protein-S-isoprenylcysteine O-methyltransferase Ste14